MYLMEVCIYTYLFERWFSEPAEIAVQFGIGHKVKYVLQTFQISWHVCGQWWNVKKTIYSTFNLTQVSKFGLNVFAQMAQNETNLVTVI